MYALPIKITGGLSVQTTSGERLAWYESGERSMAEVAHTEDLVAGLRAGRRSAKVALFDGHSRHVYRVLIRVFGSDAELADLVQEVFLRALEAIPRYRGDATGLRGWMTGIAVHTAREAIRRRQRARLRVAVGSEVERAPHPGAGADVALALRRAYQALEQMDADLRIPFTLRFIDRMELGEVASACGISLATVKRRLVKARRRFSVLAQRDVVLSEWLREGQQ